MELLLSRPDAMANILTVIQPDTTPVMYLIHTGQVHLPPEQEGQQQAKRKRHDYGNCICNGVLFAALFIRIRCCQHH